MHCQGQGFYLGLALWPGGTAEDWQPAYDASKGMYGLNPCNVTGSYNGTGVTHRAFLVPRVTDRRSLNNSRFENRWNSTSFPCPAMELHTGTTHNTWQAFDNAVGCTQSM